MNCPLTPREVAAIWPKRIKIILAVSEPEATALFQEVQDNLEQGLDEEGSFRLGTQLWNAIREAMFDAGCEDPAYTEMVSESPVHDTVRIGPCDREDLGSQADLECTY